MSEVLSIAGAILAIGVIAALVCEAVKLLVPFRGFFHRSQLEKWLGSTGFDKLLYLLGGRNEVSAVLQQPTSRLMGAIQTVASTILEHPSRHFRLYAWLTLTDEKNDEGLVTVERNQDESDVAFRWRKFAADRDVAARVSEQLTEAAAFTSRDVLDRLVERKLDAFQARCEIGWAYRNRIAAAFVGAGLAVAIINLTAFVKQTTSSGDFNNLATKTIVALSAACIAVLTEELVRAAFESRGR